MTLARFLLLSLRIRRVEFMVAEIPILAIPLLLAAPPAAPLGTRVVAEGALAFFLLFHFGDMINCLADRDVDALDKPALSGAVYGLGVEGVRTQIALTALGALALSAHLAWTLSRPLVLALAAIGLVLGAAYSVEPVRLKRRGLAQVACLWAIIFFGPMLFAQALVRERPLPAVVLFAAAYATIQVGIVLVNTAEDLPEDRAAGLRTAIVALGLHRGLTLAVAMAVTGGAGVLATLSNLCGRTVAGWVVLLPALGVLGAVLSVAYLARAARVQPEGDAVALLKRHRYVVPVLLTAVAWTCGAAALALRLGTAP